MATRAANNRLAREYLAIQKNPPPYIQAHPSEANILEWHFIITGPEDTPYEHGQYWGTLVFPPDYPFKPPAIRMMTPSGRFQTSTRLCLSISDFHPKSFNPAWEVSTILIGLLSFMTSEEMTTGSISTSADDRRILARRTRWWNSTGGGSGVLDPATGTVVPNTVASAGPTGRGVGWGDMGKRFRSEWSQVDSENWDWMKAERVNMHTGMAMPAVVLGPPGGAAAAAGEQGGSVLPGGGVRKRVAGAGASGSAATAAAGEAVVRVGETWMRRHKMLVGAIVLLVYVLLARILE
ncbi:ubiquitin-conjugating enzyme/RWD-like protein [Morchella snyderi]|nr:ubiquitin-conjugating enzyme/RWD-like protein [Morchella snyderi]